MIDNQALGHSFEIDGRLAITAKYFDGSEFAESGVINAGNRDGTDNGGCFDLVSDDGCRLIARHIFRKSRFDPRFGEFTIRCTNKSDHCVI